jgi:hypothetical protein
MSQEKPPACTLTLAGAPVLNGLKLGLTKDEVLAAFPAAKDNEEVKASLARPPNNIGTSDLVIYPEQYESKDKFAGIKRITAGFLDGKLYTLNLGYNGPEYPDVDKFVASFLEGKSLPTVDQWEAYPGLDTQMKSLKCNGFELQVYAGGAGGSQNYVLLKDVEAEKLLKDRRVKARAKATATPSP